MGLGVSLYACVATRGFHLTFSRFRVNIPTASSDRTGGGLESEMTLEQQYPPPPRFLVHRKIRNSLIVTAVAIATIASIVYLTACAGAPPCGDGPIAPKDLGNAANPAWSPDGERIAFDTDRDGDRDIYVTDIDGSVGRNLTKQSKRDDRRPSWSPDGSMIVFDSDNDIFIVDADGAEISQVTDSDRNFAPTWSPDGTKIAFASDRDGDWDIFVMDTDGTNIRRFTDSTADDITPAWSPDGTEIAFASERDGDWDIFIINADGSDVVSVVDSPDEDTFPTWSPDGSRIAFTSDRDGDQDIFTVSADGSGTVRMTDTLSVDTLPVWSPDGKCIAFASEQSSGRSYIDVIQAEVSGTGEAVEDSSSRRFRGR